MITSRPWLTSAQVAEQLGIDAGKVLDWIHSGQLPATNVATNTGGRPRWRIAAASLHEFLLRRQSPAAPAPRLRRRKARDAIEFY